MQRFSFSKAIFSLLMVAAVCLSIGCTQGNPKKDKDERTDEVYFVATIQPLYLILSELTEGRASVSLLLDPGASPHTYDPRPSDVRKVNNASALVYVDESLDGWVTRLPGGKRINVFSLLPHSMRLHFDGDGHICSGDHHHHHHHHHHDSMDDAHFWTDPITVREILIPLAEQLGKVDPEGLSIYQANARVMFDTMSELHDEIGLILMPVMGRRCVLFHPSFNYMFERYGIEAAAVVEPSPGQEATPVWLRGILQTIKEEDVRAIFTEPQLSPRPAQLLAESSGVALHEIDPLGVRGNPATIGDFLRYNARILAGALE